MHRRVVISIFALLAVLLGGGWLLTGYLDNRQDESEVRAPQGIGWQAQLVRRGRSLQGDQARQAWPLAASRGPAESMPQRLRRTARETLGGGQQHLGLRFDNAQYVDTTLGVGIWVVRGNAITCIFHERKAVSACNTSVDVGWRGLVLVIGLKGQNAPLPALPAHFLALGIAPDWARAVRLQIVGGASKTVPVIDNAYALRARAPINVERLIP